MAGILKVKAKASGGKTRVKLMAKHIMESGQRKDKSGNLIPAQFIKELKVEHAGNVVFQANLNTAISKNPYLAFDFNAGAKGDELVMTWVENTGTTAIETAEIR